MLPQPRDLKSPRLKNTLIYAAGPGIEAVLVLAIYLAVGHERLLTHTQSIPIVAAQSFCVAALMGVIINLIPHWTSKGDWSDGMGIIQSWRLPDEYFAQNLVSKNSASL